MDIFGLLRWMYEGGKGISKEYGGTALTSGWEGTLQKIIAQKAIGGMEEVINKMTGDKVKLGAEDFEPFGSIRYWDNVYSNIKSANKALGISGDLGKNIEESFKDAYDEVVNIGGKSEDVAKAFKSYISKTGRSQILSSKELYGLVEMTEVLGDESINVVSTYKDVGIGINRGTKYMKRLVVESNKVGLVPSEVMGELKDNLDAIHKFSFKNGVKGMETMAKNAILTKISMKSALELSEKLWSGGIEGAIEMGAKLQTLGGGFATMGDPFEMFYTARNEPEKFQKQLAKIASEYATINKESGEVEINAHGMSLLREAANATGQDFAELAKAGKNMRKAISMENMFSVDLRGRKDFSEILDKIAGVAELDSNTGQWMVNMKKNGKDVQKSISALTGDDVKELSLLGDVSEEDVFKSIIKSNESLADILGRLVETLKVSALNTGDYSEFYEIGKTAADNIKTILDPIILAFKALNTQTMDNIKSWAKPLSEGDLMGTGSAMWDNLTDTLQGAWGMLSGILNTALKTLGNVLWEFGEFLVSSLKYGAAVVGVELVTALRFPINSLIRVMTLNQSDGIPELEYPDAKSYFKGIDFGGAVKDAMPKWIQDMIPENANGGQKSDNSTGTLSEQIRQKTESFNAKEQERLQGLISNYISDDIRNPTGVISNGVNKSVIEVNGTIKLVTPDGKTQDLSPQDMQAIKETIVNTLRGNQIGGGKSTSPINIPKVGK